MREMQGAEDEPEGSLHEVNDQGRIPKATPQITYFHLPSFLRCVKMREMQGAEDEPAGSLHIVNDQGRIPIATPQIAYFHAPIKKFASLSRNINSPFFPHCNFAPVKGAHIVLVSI